MSYEPTTWQCGDILTADALNKMERGIQDNMSDYVPTEWHCGDTITAEKLNKMEQGIANCGGSGDASYLTVYDGSVTTSLDKVNPFCVGLITAHPSGTDSIKVTFNGTEYTVPKIVVGANYGYGALSDNAPDFTEYPFFISVLNDGTNCQVLTANSGTYTIKIEEPQGCGGSSDFSTAQVTVINNTEGFYDACIPTICEENELGEGSPAMLYNTMLIPLGESTHNVCMYKGLAYCGNVFFEADSVETLGNIVIDDNNILITGDCTITIS